MTDWFHSQYHYAPLKASYTVNFPFSFTGKRAFPNLTRGSWEDSPDSIEKQGHFEHDFRLIHVSIAF